MLGLAGCGGGGGNTAHVQIGDGTGQPDLISSGVSSTGTSGIEGIAYASTTNTNGVSVTFERRPLAGAEINVHRPAGGSAIARVVTDSEGRFRIALEPGTYTLVPLNEPGDGETLRARAETVLVPPSGFAPARIEYEGDRWGTVPTSHQNGQ
jgi:hypothetical protein